jgi:hypothetical protein
MRGPKKPIDLAAEVLALRCADKSGRPDFYVGGGVMTTMFHIIALAIIIGLWFCFLGARFDSELLVGPQRRTIARKDP